MGYIDKIEEWLRKAQDKAKELEEKYKLKDRLDDGMKDIARVAHIVAFATLLPFGRCSHLRRAAVCTRR